MVDVVVKKVCVSLSVLGLCSVLGLAGCQSSAENTEVLPSVPLVKTQALSGATQLPAWQLSGVVTARYQTPISFRVGGQIAERLVEVGDVVQADQVLFKLDPTDFALALEVTSANIRATESELENAKMELARLQKLVQRNLTSEQNVDQAKNALTVLQERLKAQQLQETQTRNQLAYAALKSPGLGKIVAISGEKGQVVAAGTPVATWVGVDAQEVSVQVPENHLNDLPQLAQLQKGAQTLTLNLREVSPQADPISRTWAARYTLPADSSLALGQTAQLRFASAVTQIQIPNTALYEKGDFASIWAVKDSKVYRVPVKVLKLSERSAWVEGDLSQVEKMVTLGVHQLNEGQAIRESAE